MANINEKGIAATNIDGGDSSHEIDYETAYHGFALRDQLNQHIYYVLIFLLSAIALFVAPLFGSNLGLTLAFPQTKAAWVVYVTVKLFVALINVMLFHCFVRQAKLNVKDDPRFIEAQRIMGKLHQNIQHARSPHTYFGQLYRRKGSTIFVTTLLSAVVLTNAILTWDITSLITYAATVVMGLIFGVMKMKDVEVYWTEEYYVFAMEQLEAHEAKQRNAAENVNEQSHEQPNVESGDSLKIAEKSKIYINDNVKSHPNGGI